MANCQFIENCLTQFLNITGQLWTTCQYENRRTQSLFVNSNCTELNLFVVIVFYLSTPTFTLIKSDNVVLPIILPYNFIVNWILLIHMNSF